MYERISRGYKQLKYERISKYILNKWESILALSLDYRWLQWKMISVITKDATFYYVI
jgi:hypothetical protein